MSSTPPPTPQLSSSTPPPSVHQPATSTLQTPPTTFSCPLDKRGRPCTYKLDNPTKKLGRLLDHLRNHGAKHCKLPVDVEAALGITKYYHAPCDLYWAKSQHNCVPTLNRAPINENMPRTHRHDNSTAHAPAPIVPLDPARPLRFSCGAPGTAPTVDLSQNIRFVYPHILLMPLLMPALM